MMRATIGILVDARTIARSGWDGLHGSMTADGPSQYRILLAEDDDLMVRLIVAALDEESVAVTHVGNGIDAVAAARREHFDLVMLDWEMPGLDGPSACRALRTEAALDDVPIIMVTARCRPEDLKTGFDSGASDYLTKPFSIGQLRARVHRWLMT
jgi:DNA-binding response OmpR family regulator